MSQVAIKKIDENKITSPSVVDELQSLSERISERAFQLFERRGARDGFAMDDWLNAERDLFRVPESELIERDGKYEARLSAPGFDPGDIQVTVLPETLIVKAASTHRHDEKDGDVRFCEFGQKTLFRRFDLPDPINVDKVTANLDKGVLQLTAMKAKPAQQQQLQQSSSA